MFLPVVIPAVAIATIGLTPIVLTMAIATLDKQTAKVSRNPAVLKSLGPG